MKVQEYRDLISTLSDAYASLSSAATPGEQEREAEYVRKSRTAVENADCPTAKPKDRERAKKWLAVVDNYLASLLQ